MNDIILGSIIGSSGAVLGGIIASIVPFVNSINDYKKWKFDKKIQLLKEKRERTEKIFDDVYAKITEGITNGSFNIDMIATVIKLCPKDVSEEFDKMMLNEGSTLEKKRRHLLSISALMKEHLAKIEYEIENLI